MTCNRKVFTFERLQVALLQALKPYDKHKYYEFDVCWTCIVVTTEEYEPTKCHLLFITFMIGSTCFGHHYAHHQDLTTITLVTIWTVRFLGCCWLEVKCSQPGNLSRLTALNFQPTATQEPDGQYGNQRYRRELLMMGILVPDTC